MVVYLIVEEVEVVKMAVDEVDAPFRHGNHTNSSSVHAPTKETGQIARPKGEYGRADQVD